MSCKIKCIAVRDGLRDWEITADGQLWPCCYYGNAWAVKDQLLVNDNRIMQEFENDPDWNNVFVKKLDNVIEHNLYNDYIWNSGWNSENPPPICVKECAVVIDEYTGDEQAKSKIQLNTD